MGLKGICIVNSYADFSDIAANDELYSLSSISVVANPNKMVYDLNSSFDSAGMKVAAIYTNANGSKSIILPDDEYSCDSSAIFTSLGNHSITIKYQEFTTTLIIRVVNSTILDITNEFIWTAKSSITASTGVIGKTTTIMQSSDYVNVAGGSTLKLQFMKWTSASGVASGYGLAFYDSSRKYISGYGFPTASSSLGNSAGESYELEVDIPLNAQYVKTTYHMDTTTYGEFSANLTFD